MHKAPLGFGRVGQRPRVIGHRGVRRPGVDENTMDAFAIALAEGAEAIELDVRCCASGELVVAHDPTLEKVTNGHDHRNIADLHLSEIKRISLANGSSIPTAHEVLYWARSHKIGINVEMKRDAPSRTDIVRQTARLVGSADPRLPIVVSSFDPAMLLGLSALVPRVTTALLVEPGHQRITTRLPGFVRANGVHIERTLTHPERVIRYLERGYFVNVWTVNDPREALDLAAIGVTGLITDDPASILAVL